MADRPLGTGTGASGGSGGTGGHDFVRDPSSLAGAKGHDFVQEPSSKAGAKGRDFTAQASSQGQGGVRTRANPASIPQGGEIAPKLVTPAGKGDGTPFTKPQDSGNAKPYKLK